MKRIYAIVLGMLVGGLCLQTAHAQKVKVYLQDGTVTKYKAEEVLKVVLEPAVPFDPSNLLSEEYVPCEGFRDWIDQHLGDGSGYYSLDSAAAYTGTIDVSGLPEVTDITGIEYFVNLTQLLGEDSYFGDFNVSALKQLEVLQLVHTKVTKLDLSELTKLKKAMLSMNKITDLVLPGTSTLEQLWCDYNQISHIDLTGCTGLHTLVCTGNEGLAQITLPACPLKTFAAHSCPLLQSIDLSGVVSTLDLVSLSGCGLTSLNLAGAAKLTYLECSENPLTSAPVLTGCKRLETLRLEDIETYIGGLNLSDCKYLNVLRLDRSNLGDSLDLSKNTKLYELSLQACNLKHINMTGCYNLGYVNVSDNLMNRLDISTCDGIYQLFANRLPTGSQIKVWKGFDIPNAYNNGYYADNSTFVYEFTE